MINIIWSITIIISIIYAIITGNINKINEAILTTPGKTIEVFITMLGITTMWSGIMKIAIKGELIEKSKKILKPLMKVTFKNIDEKSDEYNNITGNIIANLFGLGNAATIFGLKAMKKMAEKEKKLTKNMMMLIIINTASIQLIPTTLIAMRQEYKSENPTDIIIPIWIISSITLATAIILGKIFIKERE